MCAAIAREVAVMERPGTARAKAADVASDLVEDLKVQRTRAVRHLIQWMGGGGGTGLCLVGAADTETAHGVEEQAHGGAANDDMPVDLAALDAFLGRADDPPFGPAEVAPAFRAILFTDMVGSTEMTARLGDARAVQVLRIHDGLIRRVLAQGAGREVKHLGDGFMASFATAEAAVACAAAMQRALAAHNRGAAEPIHIRIGVHAGHPVEVGDGLFGSAVQLAARLCGAADPDRILLSVVVRRACRTGAAFTDLGHRTFKGFAHPVNVFALDWR